MCKKIWLFILLLPCCGMLYAQSQTPLITGIINDDRGAPVANANIRLQKGSFQYSAQTDVNGIFYFSNIPYGNDYMFTFSCLGFESQTLAGYNVKPGSTTSISIKLKKAVKELEPVVIIGYGGTVKRDITSAISSLPATDFNPGVITNAAQLLQGKVSGLNISEDGNPNGVPTVILRGPSTLNLGQQPFYVIDGIPDAAINLISANDIASIEVLKDASASAIYGDRSANGVIIITTRKAKSGEMKITYDGYGSAQKIANIISVATAAQLRTYLKQNNKALAPSDDNGGNTDWQKEVSRTGFTQNHNIGFSNGGEGFSYSGSINYFQDNAIIKGSSLDRFTGRISLQQKALKDRLKLNFSLYNMISNQTDVDTLVFYNVLRFLPTLNVFNTDGTFREDLTRTQTYNPLGLIANNQYNTKLKTILANAGAEVSLPFDITYHVNFNYQTNTTDANTYHNHYSLLAYNSNGEAIRSSYENTKEIFENYFSYDHTFSGNQNFKFLLGYSWQQDVNGDGFQTSNVNFASDATTYYNLGLGQAPAGYVPLYGNISIETLRLISFYSRFNYSYKGKYLLQGSLRRDGSSAFGVNHRWGYFPTISGAWRIINEDFIKNKNLLSDLKLRVGYGIAGNTIGFDPLTPLLLNNTTGSFYYNGTYINAIGPTQNPNPNLQWEKTAQLDAGIDFGFFDNRLTGTIDVYDKTTTDLIYNYQQPVSLSYSAVNSVYANAGQMNNKGIEFSINAVPVISGEFKWATNFNIAHNKNEVISLSNQNFKLNYIYTGYADGTGQSNISTQIIQAGYPVGQFYTLHYLGKNSNGVSTFEDKNGNPTTTPKSTDQRYLGNAQPTLTFGFGNNFKYKNFDLNIFFRGVTGNKILNATLATLNSPGDASNHNIPTLTLGESFSDYNASLYSDRYLENGAYLRLDNATFSYNLKFTSKAVKYLKLYLTATNVFTITGYRGINPEMNIGSVTPGIDNHNYYPQTRSFISGVSLAL